MRHDAAAGGAIPSLGADELVARLPPDLPRPWVEEVARLPSSHFRVDTLRTIRERVVERLRDPLVSGAVVTHGTDTLEETAYLLDLTVPPEKPVVLTGAMRAVSDVSYDGLANLLSAIQVAGAEAAQGLGAVVVFSGEIHAARYVTKMHTLSGAAFQSPGWGPVGRVEGGEVETQYRVEPRVLPWAGLEERVSLLKLGVGMEAQILESVLLQGSRGVVIEALGGGRVPPWWLAAIRKVRARGIPVVIASRCPSGRVWDSYGYAGAHRSLARLGCLFADGVNGQKARVKLMVVLAAAQGADDVTRLWTQQGVVPADSQRN
jgi:L-asparaginase